MFTNRTPDGRNNICGIKVKDIEIIYLAKVLNISVEELIRR